MGSLQAETPNQIQAESPSGLDSDNPLATEKEEESLVEGLKNVTLEDDNNSSEDLQIGESYQYPLRPHAEDCSFYLKTGNCKFGVNCKFNHPVQRSVQYYPDSKKKSRYLGKSQLPSLKLNSIGLPIRRLEKDCSYYLLTGSCAYGSSCIFNHPAEPSGFGGGLISSGNYNYNGESDASAFKFHHPKARPSNSKPIGFSSAGLPIRPDRKICWSYEKIGICKYGKTCCFHHPEELDDSL